MNFKKRVNGSWTDIPHYIHNTSTDTITTPADIYANDNNATVGLKGNMERTGTPTPTTPMQPQSCGERTAQLFDKNNANIYNAYINTSHEWILSESAKTVKIQCEPNTVYTLSVSSTLSIFRIYESANENIAPTESGIALTPILRGENKTQYTFTTSSTAKVLIFQGSSSDYNMWFNSLMLNTGSTAKPFEHYGYKIPISSANTTTPVYLGEVETTRRIKKLVLTGEENITFASEDANRIVSVLMIPNMRIKTSEIGYCNILHWKNEYSQSDYNRIVAATSDVFYMSLERSILPEQTIDGFITYLRQQYANGTPVTVWYVLAEPTTGIVNEPIRKIGDYADEVSGISIPTIAGANTISVDTTLQPSEVTVNYKGWHPVADVHERENGQWD